MKTYSTPTPIKFEQQTLEWLKAHADDTKSDVSKICRKAVSNYRAQFDPAYSKELEEKRR
jgi:hypothetical protein